MIRLKGMELLKVARLHGLEPDTDKEEITHVGSLTRHDLITLLRIHSYVLILGDMIERIYIRTGEYTARRYSLDDNGRMISGKQVVLFHQSYYVLNSNRIIPLKINTEPLNEEEKKLAIQYMEQQRVVFLYDILK